MGCQLFVPPNVRFKFDSMEEGLAAAHKALRKHYISQGNVSLKVGPGSVMSVQSDEILEKNEAEDKAAQDSGGILLQERYAAKEGFMLAVQVGGAALPPLHFEKKEDVEAVVNTAMIEGVISYTFTPDHDHLFMILGPGTICLALTVEEYENQRRTAVAAHQRQLAAERQAAAQRQPRPGQIQNAGGGRIILPR